MQDSRSKEELILSARLGEWAVGRGSAQLNSEMSVGSGLFCVWTYQDPSLSFSSFLEEALFLAYLWCVRTKSKFTVTSVASAYIMRAHVPGTASSHVSKPTISKMRRQTASCQFPSQGSSQCVCLLINMLFCAELLPMSNGSYLQQLE